MEQQSDRDARAARRNMLREAPEEEEEVEDTTGSTSSTSSSSEEVFFYHHCDLLCSLDQQHRVQEFEDHQHHLPLPFDQAIEEDQEEGDQVIFLVADGAVMMIGLNNQMAVGPRCIM